MTSKTESFSTMSSIDSDHTDALTDTTVTTYKTMGQSYLQKKLDQYVSTPTPAYPKMMELQSFFTKQKQTQPTQQFNTVTLPTQQRNENQYQVPSKTELHQPSIQYVYVKEEPIQHQQQQKPVQQHQTEGTRTQINIDEIQRYQTLLSKLDERLQRQEISQQIYNQLYSDIKKFYLEAIERALL